MHLSASILIHSTIQRTGGEGGRGDDNLKYTNKIRSMVVIIFVPRV